MSLCMYGYQLDATGPCVCSMRPSHFHLPHPFVHKMRQPCMYVCRKILHACMYVCMYECNYTSGSYDVVADVADLVPERDDIIHCFK